MGNYHARFYEGLRRGDTPSLLCANNFTVFTFDASGRNTKIVETTSGAVTSTKQFICTSDDRHEERDGTGSLTKQFFSSGEVINGTSYYFNFDHLGSITEMTNSSGVIAWQQSFDQWGVPITIVSTALADFGFCGYYKHSRSGLNVTLTRAYNASLGRFISRDSIGEMSGTNLYAYLDNDPTADTDPSGHGCNANYPCCKDEPCCNRMAEICDACHPQSLRCCAIQHQRCIATVRGLGGYEGWNGEFPGTNTWATCKNKKDKKKDDNKNKNKKKKRWQGQKHR